MRAIETIKNIWKIEDLRKRIITTILLVLVYRVGSYVVLPGIDPANLDALRSQTSKGLMQLLDMFSGGAFFYICIGYYALYHRLDCYPTLGYGDALVPEAATRRRERSYET